MQTFGKKLDSSLNKISQRTKQFGLAAVAVGAGLAIMTKKAINSADQLTKMSRKLGIAVDDLSALKFAAEFSGSSLKNLDSALGAMNRRFEDFSRGGGAAKQAFTQLGIKTKDANGELRGINDVFIEVADKLSKMEDGVTKTTIAQDIFSKSQAGLLPLLNNGAEGLAKFREQAESLGLVISEKTGAAAEKFNDNLTFLGKVAEGSSNKLAEKLLPALNRVTGALVEMASNEKVLDALSDGATTLFKNLVGAGSVLIRFVNAQRIFFSQVKMTIQNLLSFIQIGLSSLELKFTKVARNLRLKIVDLVGIQGAKNLGLNVDFTKQTQDIAKLEGRLASLAKGVSVNTKEFNNFRKETLQFNDLILETEKNLLEGKDFDSSTFKNFLKPIDIPDGKSGKLKQIKFEGVLETTDFQDKLSRILSSEKMTTDINKRMTDIFVGEDTLNPINEKIKTFYEGLTDYQTQFSDALINGFKKAEDALVEFAKTGKLDFKSLADSIISDLIRIQVKKNIIGPIAETIGGFDFSSIFGGFFADGGRPSTNKISMVGERGPELFVPDSAGTIIPNNQFGVGGSGGSGDTLTADVNIFIQAIDTQTGLEFLFKNKAGVKDIVVESIVSGSEVNKAIKSTRG